MRIIHVFRAPIGGLFRHVMDLAHEQAARGHDVGIFCDSTHAGERNERLLAELAAALRLGLRRAPMRRNPHWTDLSALRALRSFARETAADVLHGHGAKGGLYARIDACLGRRGPIRAYTPHGGSLNYRPGTGAHRAYMIIERLLARGTDAFLFESRFIEDRFHEFVGPTGGRARIVLNGLHPHEFEPVPARPDAVEFLYIGEFRFAKGVDTLLAAMHRLATPDGGGPRLILVGQGPDAEALKAKAEELGIAARVRFERPMAAREAFALAKIMVVPSRFESLPYIVIEAAGAGMPMVSTDVGGIPEIFGEERHRLIAPDDVEALATAMDHALRQPESELREDAARLAAHARRSFLATTMATTVLDAYGEAIRRRHPLPAAAPWRAPAE